MAAVSKRGRRIVYEDLSLTPYPGRVYVFRSFDDLAAKYEAMTGRRYELRDEPMGGHFVYLEHPKGSDGGRFLVCAGTRAALAHEFAHVILITFELCGIDPSGCKGEPFCYLLSQLIIDCGQSGKLRWPP